ncbi:MAG TPA: protein kinase, partial [Gemmatimonadaceae bacterium]|nr:protein kinase [Gemmatimonadaceae bacterium]
EGQPLVADFGIALAVSKAGGQRITQTGLSLGTPHYMSPEQASGDRRIDGRSDIYSLGAVTYEMLTGEAPHTGASTQSIFAKVIMDRPRDIRLSRATVPAHVEAAVNRALEKIPADRFQTAREFGEALAAKPIAGAPQVAAPRMVHRAAAKMGTGRRRLVTIGALIAAAAVAIIGAVTGWRRSGTVKPDTAVASFFVELPKSNGERERVGSVAISPDGKTVGFVAQSDSISNLYLRRVEDLESRLVPNTSGAVDIAFSPDGSWLAVAMADGTVRKALPDGSSMVTVAEGLKHFGSLTWGTKQSIVVGGVSRAQDGLALLAVSSGVVRPVTKPKTPDLSHGMPFVAEDGETLLFEDWGPGFTDDDFLAIGSLADGDFVSTPLLARHPIGMVDGRIVYVSAAGAIMAVPFNARTRRITGDAIRVMDGVGADNRGVLGQSPHSVAALSSSGTLVYTRGRPAQHLVSADLTGNNVTPLTSDDRDHLSPWSGGPRFSPDGRRIAVNVFTMRGDTTIADIWTLDATTRTFTPLTSLGNVVSPEWTPDGKRLVFTTWYEKKPTIWWQLADGSQPAEKLLELADGLVAHSANVTPDGLGVLFCKLTDLTDGTGDLFYLPFAGERKPQRIAGPFGFGCEGRVSPDGRWLAYVANEDGKTKIYLRPYGSAGSSGQVAVDVGDSPRWSRDGSRLYYRHAESALGRGSLLVARISATSRGANVQKPERLLGLYEGGVYDVSPDGTRVVMLGEGDSRVQLVVTANWIAQLRARVEGTK